MLYSLSDQELLAALIGKQEAGRLYQGSLAMLVLQDSGNHPNHMKLAAARELVQRALKEVLKRGPALSSPAAVREFLRLTLSGKEHEVFLALFLDAQNRVIETEELFRGTLTQSVYPREVVKRALYHNAGAIIFGHNHPRAYPRGRSANRGQACMRRSRNAAR
jgi:DNA repair protein RadC